MLPYVEDLRNVIDMDAIRSAGLKLGVDPLGGAAAPYWEPINSVYHLDIVVANPTIDPTFSFMTVDHDGQIRMDPSSPYAMARLVDLKNQYDVAFANDPDSDRHGIVTPSSGLMNPNHYLAVAIRYLLTHRPNWPAHVAVGKTLVSSSMIDRVVLKLGRSLCEVPVGFKWFVPGLFDGSLCFGGEESAGASFLRKDGTVWTTDKDGPIMDLLAAEITARTGKDPGELYQELTTEFGTPYYTRIDAPATPDQKARLQKLSPAAIATDTLAGERITAKLTSAPGNGAPIGGLKVVTDNGWFAARPSGTENIYKIYAESFRDENHLAAIVAGSSGNCDRCPTDRPIQLFRNRRCADERPQPSEPSSVSIRLSCLWVASARYVVALALWHWRRGTGCDRVDRSTFRRRTKLVAVVAVGPNWLRQLSLSIALVFCRQRAPDQSRLAH